MCRDVCNASTAQALCQALCAKVVPVYVCNATRYGVRGQRYDTSITTVHSYSRGATTYKST